MIRSKQISRALIFFFMFTILAAFNPAAAQAAPGARDINGHWAQAQIQAMVDDGIVTGYPDGTYGPENPLTRAEFVSMINRVFKFTQTGPINFYDVKPGDWFYNDICIARTMGYIGGYPDESMRPNDPISRQEVAVILANILKLDPKNITVVEKFSDWPQIGIWARNSIASLIENGYMSGDTDGTIKPLQATNRAAAAVIMAQVIANLGNKPVEPGNSNGNGNFNGGGNNNNGFYIDDIDVDNVKVTPDGSKNKYKTSMINTNSIGDVTVTFSDEIQKANKDDVNIRAYGSYNASGLLTWQAGAEDFVKDLLFDTFGGGDDDQLAGSVDSNYGVAYDAMSLYFVGNPEVKSLQFDFFDTDNHKLTVTVNIEAPN